MGASGKCVAAKPSLKPTEVITIIRKTADKTTDGRRVRISPVKAMARVMYRLRRLGVCCVDQCPCINPRMPARRHQQVGF
jgi:hypothetical protein